MKHFFKKNKYVWGLVLMIVLYVSYFSYFTIQRHHKLQSSYYDLGIMDQTVYNTYRGRILELTNPEGINTIKRMAIHNDILLAFLAPFYVFYQGPETLLVIQTIVLALGAIPLYLLGVKLLRSKRIALIFSFCYLMYPPLQRANIYDFHAVTLATSLLLFMFYFWTEKKYMYSFIFFILAIFSKEQVALTTGLFGMFVMYQAKKGPTLFEKRSDHDKKEIAFGALILMMSVIWFLLSFWVIIPHFRQADHFAVARYKDFGDSTGTIITGFFTHPTITLSRLFSFDAVYYLFLLTSPLLFTSFVNPLYFLIALPDLLINILSSEPNMKNILHQYTAVITPFVFLSSLYGMSILKKKYARFTLFFVLGMLGATLIMSYTVGPLPYSLDKNTGPFGAVPTITSDIAQWKRVLLDENIKVAATDTLAAQFADRKVIMRFTPMYNQSDYVVVSRDEIFNGWLDWYNMPNTYTSLKNDNRFTMVYKHGVFEVYKKI